MFCPICGETIKKGNGHHIKKCVNKYVSELTDEKINEIKRLYIEEGYSMVEMSEYMGFKYSLTEKILKRLGLERRRIKDAARQSRCREKYKETCLKNFGVEHNFSKDCSSRKAWEKRLYEEEGIVNVFQRESVKKKIRETMLEKYGEEGVFENRRKGNFIEYYIEKYGEEKGREYFEWVMKRKREANEMEYFKETYGDEWEEKWENHLQKMRKACKNNNGLNNKCEKILIENNIKYEKEYPLFSNEHSYYYDFKIGNLIIELNGIYWHCSPKKYKPNDLVKFPNNKFIKASDKWEYDKTKCEYAKMKGFNVIVIWEDEFNEERLLNIIKENTNGES